MKYNGISAGGKSLRFSVATPNLETLLGQGIKSIEITDFLPDEDFIYDFMNSEVGSAKASLEGITMVNSGNMAKILSFSLRQNSVQFTQLQKIVDTRTVRTKNVEFFIDIENEDRGISSRAKMQYQVRGEMNEGGNSDAVIPFTFVGAEITSVEH